MKNAHKTIHALHVDSLAGFSVMHAVGKNGYAEIVEILLQKGAHIDVQDTSVNACARIMQYLVALTAHAMPGMSMYTHVCNLCVRLLLFVCIYMYVYVSICKYVYVYVYIDVCIRIHTCTREPFI
jgi:hypothetical protein